jgi:hypothetical protein
MDNLIREKLIKYHETCSVDGYGQVGVIRFNEVFDRSLMDSMEDYGYLINLSTYGGRSGTFKGVEIVDPRLRDDCRQALRTLNPNYKSAMTSW